DVARIDVNRRNAASVECGDTEDRRHPLAERRDGVKAARRQIAERRQRLGEVRQLVDHRAQLLARFDGVAAIAEEPLRLAEMPVAKSFERCERAEQVSTRRLLGEREQRVGHAAECRDDDDGTAIEPRADDARGSPDRFGVGDRGSAELEDDHEPLSSPQRIINSAFSTDAPAAPRITLCPIATSFTSNTGSGRTRPTTTVIPPPASTCRRGWGRSGWSVNTSGRSGELGSVRASSAPRHSAIAPATSSADARRFKPSDTHTVWPCSTGTRLAWALTANAALSIDDDFKAPRNFRTSASILGSSSAMYGTTLPTMSSDGTPGYPAPETAC